MIYRAPSARSHPRAALSVIKAAMLSSASTRCAMSLVSPVANSSMIATEIAWTDRKILDMLPDRKPQVTFSCDRASDTCAFQFWIGQVESFFCDLQSCDVKAIATPNANRTEYKCESMQCSCIPDRMLCGESGSVDIGEFLSEEIKGPGKFSCATDGRNCKFEEPAMNNLINDIFGDTYITLMCDAGECMHYSQVPGFVVSSYYRLQACLIELV